MIRLYSETSFFENQEISLDEKQTHYIQNVMRLHQGDEILLFNGVQGEWKARISGVSKKTITLLLLSQSSGQRQEGDLWLLFSPLKPKRQEFLVEKATELGVSCLCPLRFERTNMFKINVEKMQAHVREASEQCGRLTIPQIKPLVSFPELLKNWPHDRLLFFGDESLTSPALNNLTLDAQKLSAFLVGPEGGFTVRELTLLRSHEAAQGVTLNSHILRAETAALVGAAYFQMISKRS